jgi:hypothetical protein
MPCRFGAHAADGLAHLGVRFAPERINVGVLARDFQCGIRRSAEIDRDLRAARRLYRAETLNDVIVLAPVIERPAARPFLAQD